MTDPRGAAVTEEDLRTILGHPFLRLATDFAWTDRQVRIARELLDVTVVRVEEALAAARADGYAAGQASEQSKIRGLTTAIESWKALDRLSPDNHHNALMCPYCNPDRARAASPSPERERQ
jgi:hypothetical protein